MKDTKAHILQTAFTLFLQKSFKEVTMNEIVAKTKLSKGAFYHYFSSKEQLFEEVMNHFYLEFAKVDYSRFSQQSLKTFINDYQQSMDQAAKAVLKGGLDSITMNYFLPMIDALRMLPDFKEKMMDARKREINAWTKIIRVARKNGEIKTGMTDSHVAKLFIYSGDGVGIYAMLSGQSGNMPKEVQNIWEGIYNGIKVEKN